MRQRATRVAGLTAAVLAAGLLVQCTSDPGLVQDARLVAERILVDAGILEAGQPDAGAVDAPRRDGGRSDVWWADGLGAVADAAGLDAGTPPPPKGDSFSLVYKRDGTSTPDVLVAAGSDVSATMAWVWSGGALVQALTELRIVVYDQTALARVELVLRPGHVVGPGSPPLVGYVSASLEEKVANVAAWGGTLFGCSWAKAAPGKCVVSGTVTFASAGGPAGVSGSYSLIFADGVGHSRSLVGAFLLAPGAAAVGEWVP